MYSSYRSFAASAPLDTHGKRQRAHGTTGAGALQLQLDHAILGHTYVLHIAAVGLEVGADLLKHLFEEGLVYCHGDSFHLQRAGRWAGPRQSHGWCT